MLDERLLAEKKENIEALIMKHLKEFKRRSHLELFEFVSSHLSFDLNVGSE